MLATNNNVAFKGKLIDTATGVVSNSLPRLDLAVLDNLESKMPEMKLTKQEDSLIYLNNKGEVVNVSVIKNSDREINPKAEIILTSGTKRLIIDTDKSEKTSEFFDKVDGLAVRLQTKLLNLIHLRSQSQRPTIMESYDPDVSKFLV